MNWKKNTISNDSLRYSINQKQRDIAYHAMSLFLCLQSYEMYQPAMAMPMVIPPIAIRMHIRISMIRMMIFVDFFISFQSFQNEVGQKLTGWHKYNTRNL